MANLAPSFLSFNGGEWSKRLYGRFDHPKYSAAARQCRNFIPLVQGPVTRRPAFRHVAPARGNTASIRYLPFVFSADQTYVIEATPLKFRFYRVGAPVTESAKSITGITQASPAVVTANAHGYNNGDEVLISQVTGMVEVNSRRYLVAGKTANTFQLTDLDGGNVDASAYTAYSSGGIVSRVYELTTTYTADDLPLLNVDQSKDVLYIGCPGKKPRKLTRLGDTNWTLADITFTDGPYLPENGTDTTLVTDKEGSGAGTTNVTLTFSSTKGINNDAGFTTNDIGRLVRALRRDTASSSPSYHVWSYFRITGITSSRIVTATALTDVLYKFGNTVLRSRWRLGYWSDNLGWPSRIVLHQGRAWWMSSATYPLTLWASQSDQFESYAPTTPRSTIEDTTPEASASDAFSLTLAGGQGNILRWSLPLQHLLLGSTGDERSIRGGDLSEVVAFDNAASRSESNVGAYQSPAVRINNAGIFISRDQRHVHEIAIADQSGAYGAPDMSLLAEHIGQESPFLEIAYQRRPWSIVWARREDGLLVGLTYDREQDVVSWHRHPLGGTDAKVLALTCIPGVGQDEVWIATERTIDGTTRRHVEVMVYEQIMGQSDATNFVYLDASLSYDGAPTTTLRGMEHLAGETVQVVADGTRHPDVEVSSIGVVTLERSASVVHIGYGYTSLLETMAIEIGNPAGAGLGRPKVINLLWLLLTETVGGKAGKSETSLETIPARSVGDPSDSPMALYTGRKKLDWTGGWVDGNPLSLFVVQDLPFPMTLSGAAPGYAVNEA